MIRLLFTVSVMIVCGTSIASAEERILKLVYKDIGNPPYMQAAPDNSGLYFDMMQRAAEKIGFHLKVIRLSKKRTYYYLESGRADIYASGEFRDYRSKFLFYIPNGLNRVEVFYGLTSINVPEISSISEINNYNLTWILELGSSWPLQAKAFGVEYFEIKNAGIEKAIEFFSINRPVFFKIYKEDIEGYMDKNNLLSMEDMGIRVHKKCCKTNAAPLYTGFSRFSPHYKEQPNLLFDVTRPISAENFPFELVPGSVPYKLKNALQGMIASGEITALKQKYSIE